MWGDLESLLASTKDLTEGVDEIFNDDFDLSLEKTEPVKVNDGKSRNWNETILFFEKDDWMEKMEKVSPTSKSCTHFGLAFAFSLFCFDFFFFSSYQNKTFRWFPLPPEPTKSLIGFICWNR